MNPLEVLKLLSDPVNAQAFAAGAKAMEDLSVAQAQVTKLNSDIALLRARVAELEARPIVTPNAHQVELGDTLYSLSQKYGVSLADLQAWNNLTNTVIMVEQFLRLTPPSATASNPVPRHLVLGHVALHGTGSWREKADAAVAKFGTFRGHMRAYYAEGHSGKLQADHKAWMDQGGRLFINWKPRTTSGAGSTWTQIATGARDSVIIAAAKTWAPYADRLWITIEHEFESKLGAAGSGMTAANFKAMFRHVVPLIRANAPGVSIAWTVMGAFSGHAAKYPTAWPGSDVVDILGHDPYIVKGREPAQLPVNIINGANGLRALPGAAHLPVVAAEWGADLGGATTSRGTDQHRASAIDAVRTRLADIIAAGHIELDYYDDGSDYLSASGPDVAAYKRLKDTTEAS